MASSLKYRPLASLVVAHAYYADGRCPDFVFEPDAVRLSTMACHRIAFHAEQTGFRFLYASDADDDTGAFIVPPAGALDLFVRLRLRSRRFAIVTDLAAQEAGGTRLYSSRPGFWPLESGTVRSCPTLQRSQLRSRRPRTARGCPASPSRSTADAVGLG